MKNISQYIMFALLAVGTIVFLIAFGVDIDDPSTYGKVDPALYVTYALFGVSTLLALVAAGLTMAVKPETIKTTLIGVGALVLILGISYGMASDEVLPKYGEVSGTVSKLSGAGLYAFYILFIIAGLSIVGSGVLKMVKK